MGDVVQFQLNKKTIHRLAKIETQRLNELYRISAGGQDPMPVEVDPEVEEMIRMGVIETPWTEF